MLIVDMQKRDALEEVIEGLSGAVHIVASIPLKLSGGVR